MSNLFVILFISVKKNTQITVVGFGAFNNTNGILRVKT